MSDIAIDRTELQRLAELARLHLPADREAALLGQLQDIVSAFAAIRAIELPDPAEPAAGAGAAPTPLRPDEPEPALGPDQVLANAPQRAADSFVVPRVVDA
ncbi:MAG: Asp-tRNA(Asn)/Glu-tRNA(Gln) amidotransferase subunit GatC [bacterium]|nr:Asp-tRNA(Asn)/Glu-tRNA(Gln) amidotransferase subunit GatC [bacterium]